MNKYSVEFFARCPVNGVRVKYSLEIQTNQVVPVENIIDRVEAIRTGLHEQIADDLLAAFGGQQTIVAEHHGVTIETQRP